MTSFDRCDGSGRFGKMFCLYGYMRHRLQASLTSDEVDVKDK
ncbi:hypothetical protein [Nostoc sp. LPT]|nr:hypothetical protein [Nostoc sp. LPT]